jgi:hypothetical protein
MSNIKYTDLLPEVLPHLTSLVSDPLAESAIKNAVIEFCRESWVWRHFADAQDVYAGEASIDFEAPAGAEVVQVLSCNLDGLLLSPSSTDSLNESMRGWQTVRGVVKFFVQVDMASLLLAPVPDVTLPRGLLMTLALQPRRAAVAFPQWIAAQYMEALASGALYRMMSMPGKPWSDDAGAALHHARFQESIAAARTAGVNGLGRATLRTTPQH